MSYFMRSDELPEWVEQIPKSWESNWLKWSVDLSTKRPTEKEQEVLPYISNEDITSWTGELLIEKPEPAETDSRLFQENDVLFNKLRPYLAKVYHATFNGVSSGELLCLRPSNTVVPRFLFYVLVSKGFIETINSETFGAKMPRADWEIVGHQPLPLPPFDTQRQIVRFLDKETARIDRLIEKKHELLDRLAEKRQASIARTVTEGLKPVVPLESSAINAQKGYIRATVGSESMSYLTHSEELPEWTAQIPKGWDSYWLKWSVELSTKRPTEAEQEVLPYISNEDIASWTGQLLIEKPEPAEADSRLFQENDVIFNKLRPYLAKVYHATFNGVSSGELLCLRPSNAVEPRFLFYVLVSKGFIDTVNSETFGAKMPRADWEIIGHQPLPLPPLDTQRQIVRFLDKETTRIDRLTERIEDSIKHLREYRSAQVTAAVTGRHVELS